MDTVVNDEEERERKIGQRGKMRLFSGQIISLYRITTQRCNNV